MEFNLMGDLKIAVTIAREERKEEKKGDPARHHNQDVISVILFQISIPISRPKSFYLVNEIEKGTREIEI